MTWAGRFASEGIAALVYDKRGAGKSGGEYEGKQSVSEKNIPLLADDALAALGALAGHPTLEGVPLGLTGISQAGWIAPLAAHRSRLAKFLVLWSGPVCKVSEEDIFSKYTADAEGQDVPSYREALASRTGKYIWPDFLGRDTDSREDLDRLSIARLQSLRKSGHRYDYALFSGLGHDNMDRSFAVATEWIRRSGPGPSREDTHQRGRGISPRIMNFSM